MRRHLVFASLAYVASVLALTWVKLTVLCRGDIKFEGGCGGFELYAPLNLLFTAPIFVLALAAGHLGGEVRPASNAWLAVLASLGAVVALELLDWPSVGYLAATAAASGIVLWRRLAIQRRTREASARAAEV